MRYLYALFLGLCFLPLYAQVNELERARDTIEMDSVPAFNDPKYREDQFYATISYNLMQGKPVGYSQYSFSTSLSAGFLRDMPINERRNHSVALGLGYSYSNIKHNLVITDAAGGAKNYAIMDEGGFDKNKLVLHYLEMPLELRWRNSNALDHRFWRIYAGAKVSMLLYDKAQYEPHSGPGTKVRNNDNMNRFVYSAYLSAGWNTWNFYACYALTPMYKDARMENGEELKMQSLNLGLIFYIL
ncbi:porin family protein [uncultured Flavobacterium sp.]|uniref:porin family protein n=1 Tax=uncultured Flavobacterium sp. TaxID=165435 RepID=UPI0025EBA870|nr:porin family protein [uncultured Flavobacterium sp.]